MKPCYPLGELARLLSGGVPDAYPQQGYKRARRELRARGVPVERVTLESGVERLYVYADSLRERWPALVATIEGETDGGANR